jgi:phage protein D/phage baseplate assembly protein gpV
MAGNHAQPGGSPALLVELGGRRLPQTELRGLEEVRVRQRLSMPAQCELRFDAAPGSPTALDDLAPGESLWIGLQETQETLFGGEVTAVEHAYGPAGSHRVHLLGYDRLHRLRQDHHLRTFRRASAASVARQVAAEVGLQVEAAPSRLRWPLLFQHHQSDLELLVETCARCGQYLTLRGAILYLITLSGIGAVQSLTLGQNLFEARLERNAAPARREVTPSGWDPLRATAQTQIAAQTPPPGSRGRAGEGASSHLVNESAPDRHHARALAQAEAEVRRASERILWGVAEGDPALCPGTPVEVGGVAESVAGRYVLSEVTHTINVQVGYLCEISSRPPAPHKRARGVTATVGIVTAVRDPDGRGRVQVRLPAYGDVETGWMGVLSAGAGRGKGLVIPPDKGDTVLILLSYEDPGQGIVLGGLYGTQRAPDSGVNALGQVRRYTWTTPDGQRIQLDDGDSSIHIENDAGLLGAGSQIDIKGGQILIRNRAGSYIELDGDQIVIAGKAIDFRSR